MNRTTLLGELIAEFLGTMVLLVFGAGVVAMVVLFPDKGGYTNITLGWGLGVTLGIYVAGGVSGAHLNPAVTLALAAFRGFAWSKVIPYSLAQTGGALAGAALVYWNYLPAFRKFDPALERTAGVFTTFPAFPEVLSAGLFDQVLGTAVLVGLVFAVTDPRNQPPAALGPVVVGLIVVAIGMSLGGMHGYAINPARDFGPRLMTVLAGFRNNGLTSGQAVWWVPILGPLAGGLLGGLLYDQGVRRFLPASSDPKI